MMSSSWLCSCCVNSQRKQFMIFKWCWNLKTTLMFLSIGIATPILNSQVQADTTIGNPVTASITGITKSGSLAILKQYLDLLRGISDSRTYSMGLHTWVCSNGKLELRVADSWATPSLGECQRYGKRNLVVKGVVSLDELFFVNRFLFFVNDFLSTLLTFFVQNGVTALFTTARAGNTDVMKVLIDKGASVNHTDKVSWGIVHLYASRKLAVKAATCTQTNRAVSV